MQARNHSRYSFSYYTTTYAAYVCEYVLSPLAPLNCLRSLGVIQATPRIDIFTCRSISVFRRVYVLYITPSYFSAKESNPMLSNPKYYGRTKNSTYDKSQAKDNKYLALIECVS